MSAIRCLDEESSHRPAPINSLSTYPPSYRGVYKYFTACRRSSVTGRNRTDRPEKLAREVLMSRKSTAYVGWMLFCFVASALGLVALSFLLFDFLDRI